MILKKQTTAYQEIRNDLKTGDIVLMHGLYASSRVIETVEDSLWSHSAIIVLADDIGIDAGNDNILLWESATPSPVIDIIQGKTKSGPMLVKFSERLKHNFTHKEDSKLAIRHLYTERNKKMFDNLKNLIPEVHNATFPDKYQEKINPTKGRVFNEQTSLDTIFCSELVAYTYIKLGLLTAMHPVNSYFPVDFTNKLSVELLKRAWLGNEILLDVNINKL